MITGSVVFLLIAFFFSGCAQLPESHLHWNFSARTAGDPINTVLLLPAELNIQEQFEGNVRENIPLWSAKAGKIVNDALGVELENRFGIKAITLRQNIRNYSQSIRRHAGLLRAVVREADDHTQGEYLWPHKVASFDYGIGPGLAFLKERSIDAVMYVTGYQVVKKFRYQKGISGIYFAERKNVTFYDVIWVMVLVDVKSGDILWLTRHRSAPVDLRVVGEARRMLSNAWPRWPYRKPESK